MGDSATQRTNDLLLLLHSPSRTVAHCCSLRVTEFETIVRSFVRAFVRSEVENKTRKFAEIMMRFLKLRKLKIVKVMDDTADI